MRFLLSLLLLASVLVVTPACKKGARVMAPPGYDAGGLVIAVQEVNLDDDKLELKLTFINRTGKVMYVDRDQMMVRLADGSTRARHKGTWMGMANPTHTIQPGLSHNVFMDFEVGDDVPSGPIGLVLSGVIVDGAPLPLPDYVLMVRRSAD